MIPLTEIKLPSLNRIYEGKVRVIFSLGDELLLFVATDRISAFDVVFNEGVPEKGRILTQISNFWFNQLDVAHHLVTTEINNFPEECWQYRNQLVGRSVLVRKARRIDFECVVRGYIIGSGWKDYQKTGSVCGITLPKGLKLAEKLPEPIFTPATKAPDGEHDLNIDFATMSSAIGHDLATRLRDLSLHIYTTVRDELILKGIILADTKFEFGFDRDENLLLIDECCTPDSSRFWDASTYRPGTIPQSFDKQIFRDYLETLEWDKMPPPPSIPHDIIEKTGQRYGEMYQLITGEPL